FQLFSLQLVVTLKPCKSVFNPLWRWMNISLTDHDAGVPSNLLDRKRVRTSFSEAGQHCVAKVVEPKSLQSLERFHFHIVLLIQLVIRGMVFSLFVTRKDPPQIGLTRGSVTILQQGVHTDSHWNIPLGSYRLTKGIVDVSKFRVSRGLKSNVLPSN